MCNGGSRSWKQVPADGSGPETPLRITPRLSVQEVTFSPDGRYAIVREDSRAGTGRAIRNAHGASLGLG